jgi:NTE family protein
MTQGDRQAEEFLTALAFEQAWRRRDMDALAGLLHADADLVSAAPFPEHGPVKGAQLDAALRELSGSVRMDLTRKQLAREAAAWTVVVDDAGTPRRGRIEAVVRDGRVVRIRLGSPESSG